jgi:peptidoglycan/xylan/chitin deacetylase (PgdA/CDA1 family)
MLAILTYHSLDKTGSILSVAPARFAEQMAYLANLGVRGISLREAVVYRDVNRAWPEKCAVLTFDDGYENFYESALPVLMQHSFSATVFLLSDLMAGFNNWGPPPPLLGTRRLLSWDHAVQLSAMGIELGSHTRTHPDLRQLTPQETEDEIIKSRDAIVAQVGQPVESFAYPFGNISAAACATVKREFRAGCTTILKRVGREPLHALPRIDMYYIQSLATLKRLLTGTLDPYLALRRWGRSMRSGFVLTDHKISM